MPDHLTFEQATSVAWRPAQHQNLVMFLARPSNQDLTTLAGLVKDGKITPVIDRRYSLSDVPQAIRYLEEGHARGKVVIPWS